MLQKTTAQSKIAAIKERVRIIQGGTASSKTFSILALLIDYAIKRPMSEISVVSESVPHLRRGSVKDFQKIMVWTGMYQDEQFNKSTYKYTFSNNSYIEFFSADQPDKLRGARRHVLFINECNNISFEAYMQLAIRTSRFIYLDYNPTAKFWAHTELEQDNNSKKIVLTYKDNEALEDIIVKEIEKAQFKKGAYWENWWQVYGLGEVGMLEGVCIPEWELIDSAKGRLLCYGMDFGYSIDPTCIIGLYKYNEGYIFDEVAYKKGMLNRDISNVINTYDIKEIIYADSAEPKSIAELQGYGHKVIGVKKGADSIVYGINLINQNKIYITQRSKHLIDELKNYTWKKDKTGVALNKPVDAFNHCIDAARYALISELENPFKNKYFVY
jgi:phage terminase large subunit